MNGPEATSPGLRDDIGRLEQIAEKMVAQIHGLEGRLASILDPASSDKAVSQDSAPAELPELRARVQAVTDVFLLVSRTIAELTDRSAL